MKKKKVCSFLLAMAMTLSLAACGSATTTDGASSAPADSSGAAAEDEAPAEEEGGRSGVVSDPQTTQDYQTWALSDEELAEIVPNTTVTLNIYSQLANYSGEMTGWFADLLLEKFNVKFNIIPEADGVFATRMESGDLGDIVIFGSDGGNYTDAVDSGMLLDWNEDDILADYGPYMNEFYQPAFEKNASISGGTVYGFGHDVASDAGDFGSFDYHPDLRWDLYEQLGYPELNTLEDYVAVLKQMKEIAPTSDSGKETYGVSLFKDWDGDMVMFVKATASNFFGVDESNMGFYDKDGNYEDALAEGGYYERCLRFYNQLYREGLMDPDSNTQGYDACMEDYRDGAAFMCIFGWMAAPQYNNEAHLAEGKKMLPVVAKEEEPIVYGLATVGSNRVWSIGAKTQYPELCMAIIDWLATPEGALTNFYGPKDTGWEYLSDGSVDLTDFGMEAARAGMNVDMPAPYSGKMIDGSAQFNNTTYSKNTKIPGGNGQTFNYEYWPKYAALPVDAAEQSWREYYGATSVYDYMSQQPYAVIKPNTYAATAKSDELSTLYDQVKKCIQENSWLAIYAESEAQFDEILVKMRTEAEGYGYSTYIEWCQEEAVLRKAAELD
ncbi:MAG: hypothetical protein LBQ15_12915 [Clostridium sp.]|jgi:multiple sugar transport system substrate-binding protein/putative aldouronate transport system substrate-binding protein|nr:hypothetical protein [Clostridium sp.]